MLLKQATVAGIAAGTVRCVYRRWRHPAVKPGSAFRTSAGVIRVDKVEPTSLSAISERAARLAGFDSRSHLLAELAKYREGRLYRVSLRLAGPDPRTELRRRSRLGEDELAELERSVARLGARTPGGAWGPAVLRLIAARPAVRAPDLARAMGMETARFKARVRQLKELGLTESLEVGYRLSPRGRAFLRRARSTVRSSGA